MSDQHLVVAQKEPAAVLQADVAEQAVHVGSGLRGKVHDVARLRTQMLPAVDQQRRAGDGG